MSKTKDKQEVEELIKKINNNLWDSQYNITADVEKWSITFIKNFYGIHPYLHNLKQKEMILVLSSMETILNMKEEKL